MKRFLISLTIAWPLAYGVVHGQTPTTVWSCLTNCSSTSNTYNDGAFRAPSPAPAYVAATNGTNTACTRNWWNTVGSVRWRRPADIAANHCVAIRVGTSESFAPASQFGWPPSATPPTPVNCVVSEYGACSAVDGKKRRTVVTPPSNGGAACPILEDDCQLPAPTVVLSINKNPILIGESVTISWTSTNAAFCQVNYEAAISADLAGSRTLGPFTFAQTVSLGVICRSFFGEYGAFVSLQVHAPPTHSPNCFPHLGDARKVRAEPLQTTGTRYDLKAVWFCGTPEGPRKMAWVTSYSEIAKRAAQELAGIDYDEEEARAQCESTCETLPPGPLKDELDAFAAQFTAEQLGVIE
jgi:hypothetical protein